MNAMSGNFAHHVDGTWEAKGHQMGPPLTRRDVANLIEMLKRDWPHRGAEIDLLVDYLGGFPARDAVSSYIMVTGEPSTGKSAVTRAVLASLELPHAWVPLQTCTTDELIFRSILVQLLPETAEEALIMAAATCRSVYDFIIRLKMMLPERNRPVYVVLDGSECLLHRSRSSAWMAPALSRISETAMRNIGLVIIGRPSPWELDLGVTFLHSAFGVCRAVRFSAYTPAQLMSVLAQRPLAPPDPALSREVNEKLHADFLQKYVASFCRVSTDVRLLRSALSPLFVRYRAPVIAGAVSQSAVVSKDRTQGDRLFNAAREHARHALHSLGALVTAGVRGRARTDQLGFDLTVMGKLLVIAAFIASCNPEGADKRLFGSAKGSRKRTRNLAGTDKREDQARVAQMEGPRSFSLERLLWVVKNLLKAELGYMDLDPDSSGAQDVSETVLCGDLNAETLHLVETLVALRLLKRSSQDVLDSRVTYKCLVEKEMVEALAKNVGIEKLDKYLVYIA